MILVILGTQDKKFLRLIKKVETLKSKNIIKEKVIVQSGFTKYQSKHLEIFDYIDNIEFQKLMKKAKYVISHSGVGSILECLNFEKKVIVVPRLKKYKEHVNDHQVEIAKKLSSQNNIIYCDKLSELEKHIKDIDKVKLKPYKKNNKNFIKFIEKEINRYL